MANAQWMPAPQVEGCPRGLEYLSQVDQLIVEQKVELLEAFTGWEGANKYVVKNTLGQQVYYAAENSGCCERQCCKNARSFEMRVVDNMNQDIMLIKRPLRCTGSCWCCECMRQYMEVECPPGEPIGYIKADCSCCFPSFSILTSDMQQVLKVKAPCGGYGCINCCNPKYKVEDLQGVEVGVIQKKWSGLAKELFTQADNFGITFPMDLDVKVKGTLLAALFMIDFIYFEEDHDDEGQDLCCLFSMLNILA